MLRTPAPLTGDVRPHMKLGIDWKALVLAVGISVSIATGTTYIWGLSFWWAFIIAIVAILVNGLITVVEDGPEQSSVNLDRSSTLPNNNTHGRR